MPKGFGRRKTRRRKRGGKLNVMQRFERGLKRRGQKITGYFTPPTRKHRKRRRR